MRVSRLALGLGVVLASVPAVASNVTYQYDANGRLIGSTIDRGTTATTTIGYDAADNRTGYSVSGSGASAMAARQSSMATAASPETVPANTKYVSKAYKPVIADALATNKALQRPR